MTVNILACNRRDELRLTLEKISQELDYPPERLEIIVVDNASTDGTAEMVAANFPEVRLSSLPKNQGIAGWNEGFRNGQGDYFLVLDDDCYMSGDSLKRAIEAAEAQEADLVSFRVTTPHAEGYDFRTMYNPGLLAFWGCSVLISRRALERLEGFDSNIFVWGHELEFTIRFLDAGFKHLFLPHVISSHLKRPPPRGLNPEQGIEVTDPGRSSFDTVAFFETRNRFNTAYVAGKLLRLPDALLALGDLVIDSLIFAYRCRTFAALALVRANLSGFAQGLRNRQPVSWAVSRLYKKNFVDYANPLLRLHKRPRRFRFSEERPAYYPAGEAALKITPRTRSADCASVC